MKSTVLALFAAVMLVVSTAAIVNAGNNDTHELTEILVERDFHHVGDGDGFTSFLIPDAEGISWETTFRIPQRQYDLANTAHLELWVLGSGHLNSWVINGRSVAFPSSVKQPWQMQFSSKTVVSIPLAWLKPGSNTIEVASGQLSANPDPENTHDDIEFGEVVLLLSS